MAKPEKVVRNGKVAVLVSPGFGAGWSTWNSDYGLDEFMLFDRTLVALIESGNKDEEAYREAIKRANADWNPYLGGLCDLRLKWLPEGTVFRVKEYDGSESLVTTANLSFVA